MMLKIITLNGVFIILCLFFVC